MLATLFGRNLSSSDFSSSLSYLSRKKGTSETFLSLSLFISRPRPTASASKIRLRLRKTFPQFPFFYFGNLEKLKSDEDKFFLRVASTIIETKYYFFEFHSLIYLSAPLRLGILAEIGFLIRFRQTSINLKNPFCKSLITSESNVTL